MSGTEKLNPEPCIINENETYNHKVITPFNEHIDKETIDCTIHKPFVSYKYEQERNVTGAFNTSLIEM